jgi:hypothetical protein
VAFRDQVAEQGCDRQAAARLLGVQTRTLRRWEQASRGDGLQPRPLGRPVGRSPRTRRSEVLRVLAERGPGVALASLREQFKDMARAELADLLKRYRLRWIADSSRQAA